MVRIALSKKLRFEEEPKTNNGLYLTDCRGKGMPSGWGRKIPLGMERFANFGSFGCSFFQS